MRLSGDERKQEAAALDLKKKIPGFLQIQRSRNVNNESSEEPTLSEEGLEGSSQNQMSSLMQTSVLCRRIPYAEENTYSDPYTGFLLPLY